MKRICLLMILMSSILICTRSNAICTKANSISPSFENNKVNKISKIIVPKTTKKLLVYKSPSLTAPRLIDSDEGGDFATLTWEKSPNDNKYAYLQEYDVLPVIEETNAWYKVYTNEWPNGSFVGYVPKSECKEISTTVHINQLDLINKDDPGWMERYTLLDNGYYIEWGRRELPPDPYLNIGKIENGIRVETTQDVFIGGAKDKSKGYVSWEDEEGREQEMEFTCSSFIMPDDYPVDIPDINKLSSGEKYKLLSLSKNGFTRFGIGIYSKDCDIFWIKTDGEFVLALGYRDDYNKIMEQCSTLEDVSKVIDNDNYKNFWINVSDEFIARDYNQEYFAKYDTLPHLEHAPELAKQRELLSEKAYSLYRALWKENNGDINKLKSIYNSGGIKSAIDSGLLLYAMIKGYNADIRSNDLDTLEWLCNNCPSDYILENLKAVWTRAKLRSLINNESDWPEFRKVFSSSNYCAIDGIDPYRYNGRGNISTNEQGFSSIKNKYLTGRLDVLKNKETIDGISYDSYMERALTNIDTSRPSVESLETMKTVLSNNLDELDADFKGYESYLLLRNQTKGKVDLVNVLINEHNGNVSYNDYNALTKASNPSFQKYAERRMPELQKRRTEKEIAVIDRTVFSKADIKLYKKFITSATEAKPEVGKKKLKAEFVNSVKSSYIDVAFKECTDAYNIYPVGEYSDIYLSSKEDYDVTNIILMYWEGKDILATITPFLKEFPNSYYKPLLQELYKDRYGTSLITNTQTVKEPLSEVADNNQSALDGANRSIKKSPAEPDTPPSPKPQTIEKPVLPYILNTDSIKFHNHDNDQIISCDQTGTVGTDSFREVVIYKNGTSKLSDTWGNWILFKTEYEINKYTGETTNNPIKADEYINGTKNIYIIAANICDKGNQYSISLSNDTVTLRTPVGLSVCASIIPQIPVSSFFEKKQLKLISKRLSSIGASISYQYEPFVNISLPSSNYIWSLDSKAIISNQKRDYSNPYVMHMKKDLRSSVRSSTGDEPDVIIINDNHLDEISRILLRLFKNPSLLVPSYDFMYARPSSIITTIKLLSDYSKLFGNDIIVKGPNNNELFNFEDISIRLLNGKTISGGYYDDSTKRMYFPLDDKSVLQACSNEAAVLDVSSIRENNVVWIKCLRSDVIERYTANDKIGELYFTNGNYIKFSKLNGGQVFDCHVNRPTGLCVIKLDDEKPQSVFKCTQGSYKGITCELGKRYYDDILTDKELLDPNNNSDLEHAYWRNVCETRSRAIEERAAEVVTFETVVEESYEEKKAKAMKTLEAKYGKKYVDALQNGKILIGTPEELILKYTNSTLKSDNLYTRKYSIIDSFLGHRSCTVWVNKNTKKVTSVTYY